MRILESIHSATQTLEERTMGDIRSEMAKIRALIDIEQVLYSWINKLPSGKGQAKYYIISQLAKGQPNSLFRTQAEDVARVALTSALRAFRTIKQRTDVDDFDSEYRDEVEFMTRNADKLSVARLLGLSKHADLSYTRAFRKMVIDSTTDELKGWALQRVDFESFKFNRDVETSGVQTFGPDFVGPLKKLVAADARKAMKALPKNLGEESSRVGKIFGDFRSALTKRPVDLDKIYGLLTLFLHEDEDYYYEVALPYMWKTLERIKGVTIEETGNSRMPVIINLEGEGLLKGDVYAAAENSRFQAKSSSLQGMVDTLYKMYPSGLGLHEKRPGKLAIRAYDNNGELRQYDIVHLIGSEPLYPVEVKWLRAAFR